MVGVYDLNTDEKIPEGYPSKITSTAACGSTFAGPMVSTAGKALLRATSRFMMSQQLEVSRFFISERPDLKIKLPGIVRKK
jgi:hypothetical protein